MTPRALGGMTALLLLLGCGRSSPPAPAPPSGPAQDPVFMATPFIMAGLKTPAVSPAAAADLPDDAEVVGFVVAGKARAYLVDAMSTIRHHVINDLVGDAPLTVTYCDRADCFKAFTADARGTPLDVYLGGWKDGMLLKVGESFFYQDTGRAVRPDSEAKIPLRTVPAERTRWKAWKQKHPETDIFTGKK